MYQMAGTQYFLISGNVAFAWFCDCTGVCNYIGNAVPLSLGALIENTIIEWLHFIRDNRQYHIILISLSINY